MQYKQYFEILISVKTFYDLKGKPKMKKCDITYAVWHLSQSEDAEESMQNYSNGNL